VRRQNQLKPQKDEARFAGREDEEVYDNIIWHRVSIDRSGTFLKEERRRETGKDKHEELGRRR
jgi:hypothetical protein